MLQSPLSAKPIHPLQSEVFAAFHYPAARPAPLGAGVEGAELAADDQWLAQDVALEWVEGKYVNRN